LKNIRRLLKVTRKYLLKVTRKYLLRVTRKPPKGYLLKVTHLIYYACLAADVSLRLAWAQRRHGRHV
jgi:hypothetical protein